MAPYLVTGRPSLRKLRSVYLRVSDLSPDRTCLQVWSRPKCNHIRVTSATGILIFIGKLPVLSPVSNAHFADGVAGCALTRESAVPIGGTGADNESAIR